MNRPTDPLDLLLSAPLDLSVPFNHHQAFAAGLDKRRLRLLVGAGLVVSPLRTVYRAAHLEDSLELRLACVRLMVPADAVVTDRTAGWLHGAEMVLAPGDHLVVPALSVFQSPGNRLRNALTVSGERRFASHDVVEIDGMRVTTPLRTACDLGRLLHRDAALAALDALLALGAFSLEELIAEVDRFRGFRGVRQLRVLAPLADAGSESFGESALRLRWYDATCLPTPVTQVEVHDAGRFVGRVDLAAPDARYAAEYDGEAFHGPDQAGHDASRRAALAEAGWVIDVFRRRDVFGRDPNAIARLARGYRLARLRAG